MIEYSRMNQGPEKRVYGIPEARVAIAAEATTTLQRLRDNKRMNTGQRAQMIAEIESLLKRSDDPSASRQLDEIDTKAKRILKHLA